MKITVNNNSINLLFFANSITRKRNPSITFSDKDGNESTHYNVNIEVVSNKPLSEYEREKVLLAIEKTLKESK